MRKKHEKCFQKGEGWELYFRLAYYSQLCLMEGLIFKTGIFRVRMHDFSILPFYSSEQCLPHSHRTVQLRSAL